MGFSDRFKSFLGRGGSPHWAMPLEGEGLRRFTRLIEAELRAHGDSVRCDFESGTIQATDRDLRIGLSNLAQTCAMTPESKWRTLVREHLERSLAVENLAAQASFEAVEPILKLRFTSFGVVPPSEMWTRTLRSRRAGFRGRSRLDQRPAVLDSRRGRGLPSPPKRNVRLRDRFVRGARSAATRNGQRLAIP